MSLQYPRDPSFEATDTDGDGDGGGDDVSGQKEVEAATLAAQAEEKARSSRERRRLYVRLLVGAGLLVLSAAVVALGLSLYSMEFRYYI